MPKRKDVKKVLVIGSGPIIIGQAAEFDYAGTQACRVLKQEGLEVVLINSNPATIMTDTMIADKIYIEPLDVETVEKVIKAEKPDSLLATLGGQTGLNLAMALSEDGFLEKNGVKLLGTNIPAIKKAEDRQDFKDTMASINQPCVASKVVTDVEDAAAFAKEIGYPIIVRPGYTLGGTGGGIAGNEEELRDISENGIRLSRVGQVLIERCISGWKEIEYEVMRDGKGTCIAICSMENFDPVGVHTGDSIVAAPNQTLSDKENAMLKHAALSIIDALGIEGGCNVQFALHPVTNEYAVIEVNPRLSRSSALASKATGYPIAKVAVMIALGYTLDEIPNAVTGKTTACFEPSVDYCVLKIPRWPFDKFNSAKRTLGTQMKATGEVMAIAPTFEAAMMKAVRSLDPKADMLTAIGMDKLSDAEVYRNLYDINDTRLFTIAEALRRGVKPETIAFITKINIWFLNRIHNLVKLENRIAAGPLTADLLKTAKKTGFTDRLIARLAGNISPDAVREMRFSNKILPSYKMVDTCAGEFDARTPYYYSTYDTENEAVPAKTKKKVIVFGSGPIRIGQGIEFDYCSVHSVWAYRKKGYETIIINNNPETVSTDFDISDKLYFEPLSEEDVQNIIELEKPMGVVVQFGGQTAINLTKHMNKIGVKILGSDFDSIDTASDKERFDAILEKLSILRPKGKTVFTVQEGIKAANELGYPVLVRPSYVLGGQGMEIAHSDADIAELITIINRVKQDNPILVDKYMMGKELEVDAVCDGEDVLIPGIMEHIERAGVHSGDSITVYPTQTIEKRHKDQIVSITTRLTNALKVVGMINVQYILCDDKIYVIEANPRSSRTVPYISKITGLPIIEIATECMLGGKLKNMSYGTGLAPEGRTVAVKMPVFSFEKLHDVDTSLGPEMKSTGEVLGVDPDFGHAMVKAFRGAGVKYGKNKAMVVTVCDRDKAEMVGLMKSFIGLGYKIYATEGNYAALKDAGMPCEKVNKLHEEHPTIADVISRGKVDFVINTPTKGRQSNRDGFRIRRISVERNIPCLTSMDTAKALLMTLKGGHDVLSVINIAALER